MKEYKMRSFISILDRRIFHLVHASCKEGEGSLSFNVFDNNIGRPNPSSIIKTSNFDIKILGKHRLIKNT